MNARTSQLSESIVWNTDLRRTVIEAGKAAMSEMRQQQERHETMIRNLGYGSGGLDALLRHDPVLCALRLKPAQP